MSAKVNVFFMRINSVWISGIAMMLFTACNVIEYHPYDTRITGDTDVNARNILRIENSMSGRKSIRFAMISDTQRRYDETEDVVNLINSRGDIDFVLHGGDLADFGETKEFLWARDVMDKLQVPYVCLLGNHDCLGTGRDVFRTVFGEENFSFVAGNVRFICLNTNALEYDYSHPVPDFNFMENALNTVPDGVEKTVVAMHVPPGDMEFNNNVYKAFEHYVKSYAGLQFCLYGHVHNWNESELFDDGVMYYGCTTVGKRGYFVITINEEGYEVEKCTF